MKITLLLLTACLGLSAQATDIHGSGCGLIDSADDFALSQSEVQSIDSHSQLSIVQKRQIITAADSSDDLTGIEALNLLLQSSEANEVDYETGVFNGQSYEIVRYYPGGNTYGAIFKKGSATPVAWIADSDLLCQLPVVK